MWSSTRSIDETFMNSNTFLRQSQIWHRFYNASCATPSFRVVISTQWNNWSSCLGECARAAFVTMRCDLFLWEISEEPLKLEIIIGTCQLFELIESLRWKNIVITGWYRRKSSPSQNQVEPINIDEFIVRIFSRKFIFKSPTSRMKLQKVQSHLSQHLNSL